MKGSGDQGLDREGADNYDTDTLIEMLGELRRFLGGEKAPCSGMGYRPTAAPPWVGG